MCKCDSHICCQPLFKTIQLTRIYKIVQYGIELEPITNDLLNEFFNCVEKYNGSECLGELYDFLLGFEIMINIEILKWEGQWPNSKHASAMLMIFFRHNLSLTIILRCYHDNLSGPGADELLYLMIELMNSSEKGAHLTKICLEFHLKC